MDDTLTKHRSSWQALLEELTRGRRGQLVTLEVLDDDLGDQTPAHGLPLDSIGYDPRDDVIVLGLAGHGPGAQVVLRHLIADPVTLDLLDQPEGRLVLRVVDASGLQTLIAVAPGEDDRPD